MAGTPTGTISLDSGNAANASYLGGFELYTTATTGSSTWSPGSVTMPSNGLMCVIFTGRSDGTAPVDLTGIDIGGSAATLYHLYYNAGADKIAVACLQVSSGSNAIAVHFSGTLTGAGSDCVCTVGAWYISGQTSDVPRNCDTKNPGASTSCSMSINAWGKSVTLWQIWLYQCTTASPTWTGDTLTTDVAFNAIGAKTSGAWGAGHLQNTSADLTTSTVGSSWTTSSANQQVVVTFK